MTRQIGIQRKTPLMLCCSVFVSMNLAVGFSFSLPLTPPARYRLSNGMGSPNFSSSLYAATSSTTTASTIRPDLAEQLGNEPTQQMLDEDELLSSSSFPIPADELIQLAKAFTAAQLNGDAASWFADDFRFVAPVVGPFGKDEFIDSLSSFDLKTAFENLNSNYHHWRVCPFDRNRVYYSIKYTGSNDGPVMGRPATYKSIESPVQAHSITFNERGEVTKFTIGYVLDKETGNTGGLGGVFGLFYAIGYGLPFPEAQPYKPSLIYGNAMKFNRNIQSIFKSNPDFKNAFQKVTTIIGGKKE
mmetsp:Transcript_45004/g.54088  ORF Transcript_45004/g.54088 Transcript_45004/m.54088 type:complete len:301 (+) Transcript_45004:26-928(+)